MATVRRHISAPSATVFAVLADGWLYSNWVVGTSHMRAVEDRWPAVGSRLFHASGAWPMVTRDETVVEAVDEPRRLVLRAKGGVLGQARITIELIEDGALTEVVLGEVPVAGLGKWAHNPLSEAILARRNVEALARLAAVVERRTAPGDD